MYDVASGKCFAGQYYDTETGLHYNYFRYYDPRTGRYITSDPIGLAGGLNTYGYVFNNPLYWSDFYGLAPGDLFKSPDDVSKKPKKPGHKKPGQRAIASNIARC